MIYKFMANEKFRMQLHIEAVV